MKHCSAESRPAPVDPIQVALKRFFGYDEFRSPQRAIVESLLQQQDALIILPTGGGKSICFQLPALMQPKLTLVVSPLVALMENQVQELRQQKLPAAMIHSQLPKQQYHQVLWLLANQRLRLLYLSPETLLNPKVWQVLSQPTMQIHALVVDEAHCLAQWGETFRPAYYRLGAVRRSLVATTASTKIAIAAFTATADPAAQQTMQQVLQLEQPQRFQFNPYRANLHLAVQTIWTPHQRRQRLLTWVGQQGTAAGLVYVRTRRDCAALATELQQQGFATVAYHAGLRSDERRSIEQRWLTGALQFVVCTNAFGMGINHPTVRWVAHYQAPLLLAEYVQEVGRAGRDGKPAIALMLASEPTGLLDGADQQRWQFFTQQAQKQYRRAKDLIRKLPESGEVAAVSRQFEDGAIALSLLHQAGLLEWTDPFHYVIHARSRWPQLGRSNQQAAHQMKRFVTIRTCRWQFLLAAFGFEAEAAHWRCGHCDNCLS